LEESLPFGLVEGEELELLDCEEDGEDPAALLDENEEFHVVRVPNAVLIFIGCKIFNIFWFMMLNGLLSRCA